MRLFVIFILFLCTPLLTSADGLTRQEISIMHKMGVRMALRRERPYVVPLSISPREVIKTELLDFSGMQLKQLPAWISNFRNLRKLDLSNCGVLVKHILDILSNNQLGGNLEVLLLSGGEIKSYETIPENYWNSLPRLRVLDFSNMNRNEYRHWYTQPKTIKHISKLQNLVRLDLSGSFLDGSWWHHSADGNFSDIQLNKMVSLRELNISDANIDLSSLLVTEIPPNLEKLDISNNKGDSLNSSFGDLFALPNLVQIKVDNNVSIPSTLKEKLQSYRR